MLSFLVVRKYSELCDNTQSTFRKSLSITFPDMADIGMPIPA
jgi:hypothetical protein